MKVLNREIPLTVSIDNQIGQNNQLAGAAKVLENILQFSTLLVLTKDKETADITFALQEQKNAVSLTLLYQGVASANIHFKTVPIVEPSERMVQLEFYQMIYAFLKDLEVILKAFARKKWCTAQQVPQEKEQFSYQITNLVTDKGELGIIAAGYQEALQLVIDERMAIRKLVTSGSPLVTVRHNIIIKGEHEVEKIRLRLESHVQEKEYFFAEEWDLLFNVGIPVEMYAKKNEMLNTINLLAPHLACIAPLVTKPKEAKLILLSTLRPVWESMLQETENKVIFADTVETNFQLFTLPPEKWVGYHLKETIVSQTTADVYSGRLHEVFSDAGDDSCPIVIAFTYEATAVRFNLYVNGRLRGEGKASQKDLHMSEQGEAIFTALKHEMIQENIIPYSFMQLSTENTQ